jgi:hypothetical protein
LTSEPCRQVKLDSKIPLKEDELSNSPLRSGLCFHEDASQSLALGGPNADKFQTKALALDPSHHRLIDPQGPLLVLQK